MARKRKGRDISGWLVVDKPAGMTSTAVVNKVRWALDANKAGHAGTLDPKATGLLLIMIMAGVSFIAFLGLTVGTASGMGVRVIVSVAMGVGGVFTWVSMKAGKRMALLEEQLPDAIELMVRSLRVGHPFSSAISIVATEVADPLATEFGVIAVPVEPEDPPQAR